MFRQAVLRAVSMANVTKDYTRVKPPTSRGTNESVYALSDCWKPLNSLSCRACLENASASVLKCLPSSNGYALNAGCFVRHSDANFLDVRSGNVNSRENGSTSTRGNQRGKGYTLIIAVSLGVGLAAAAASIGLHVWKCRKLQKNTRGPDGKEKPAEGLHDFSLIFKYSILKKATGF